MQKYLEVKEPPFGVDPMAIENIEDIPSQKAILQTVLEYLRLQDGDGYDETELQQEFLDAFSVSNRVKNEIINHVELLYGATGARGLAEKYGYVPEEEAEEVVEKEDQEIGDQITASTDSLSPEVADKIVQIFQAKKGNGFLYSMNNNMLELDDYFLVMGSSGIKLNDYGFEDLALYAISKKTGDRQFIFGKYGGRRELDPEDREEIDRLFELEERDEFKPELFSRDFWNSLDPFRRCVFNGNTVFYEEPNYGDGNDILIFMIDVPTKTVEQIGKSIDDYSLAAAKKPYLIFKRYNDEKDVILFNYDTKKKHLLNMDKSVSIRHDDGMYNTIWMKEKLYAGYSVGYGSAEECGIAAISPEEKQCTSVVKFEEKDINIVSMELYDNALYVLARVGWSSNNKYNIYYVPVDNPSEYTVVKKNITIDGYSHKMRACARGWIFIDNDWDYTLKIFDFSQREFISLATGCGYNDSFKLHVWSKSERSCNPYDFYVIGDSVYFENGERRKVKHMKLSLSDPSQVELID